ncbi:hypothetical protein [Frigidibacter sp. SD6-1]|uniref:hypothetical protein n=1 Tax=Frigidibacter sp. SD6-1 TaxID=3032581 RepID=UPI0024DF9294|nr:hypothetical protein [Frigidibacter sp. SD6-1]
MKNMSISFHFGANAPLRGWRCFPGEEDSSTAVLVHEDGEQWVRKGSSRRIEELFDPHIKAGRNEWAQLSVRLDGVALYFWLPEELDHVCSVFAMQPFPTALGLTRGEEFETTLNKHWLSSLPACAKKAKFRGRFLKLVRSQPVALQSFKAFYERHQPVDGTER